MQIDASPHDWLEGHGPRLSLVAAIDNATGRFLYACFRPTEDMASYLHMLHSVAEQLGLPKALYHDRHIILRSPKDPTIKEERSGKRPMSQVQAVLEGLGIRCIAALSPQAKGRVERLWRTLQDRLTKELRYRVSRHWQGRTSSCRRSSPASTRALCGRAARLCPSMVAAAHGLRLWLSLLSTRGARGQARPHGAVAGTLSSEHPGQE